MVLYKIREELTAFDCIHYSVGEYRHFTKTEAMLLLALDPVGVRVRYLTSPLFEPLKVRITNFEIQSKKKNAKNGGERCDDIT